LIKKRDCWNVTVTTHMGRLAHWPMYSVTLAYGLYNEGHPTSYTCAVCFFMVLEQNTISFLPLPPHLAAPLGHRHPAVALRRRYPDRRASATRPPRRRHQAAAPAPAPTRPTRMPALAAPPRHRHPWPPTPPAQTGLLRSSSSPTPPST
jgi:hypothetical protein